MLVLVQAPVATAWLCREEKRNALGAPVLASIEEAFLFLHTRFDIDVVVLAGRGKSFSAGAEVATGGFAPGDPDATGPSSQRERRHAAMLGSRVIRAIMECEAVTIARVQGHAIGGGFGLMQACDLRIVMEDALLFFPEVDLGSGPVPWGLTPMLARDIGLPKAKELIMLCDAIEASEALGLGLINKVVATEAELDEAVDDYAYRLAAKPQGALHGTKLMFRALEDGPAVSSGNLTGLEPDLNGGAHSRL